MTSASGTPSLLHTRSLLMDEDDQENDAVIEDEDGNDGSVVEPGGVQRNVANHSHDSAAGEAGGPDEARPSVK